LNDIASKPEGGVEADIFSNKKSTSPR